MSKGEDPPQPPDVQRKIREMTEAERRAAKDREEKNDHNILRGDTAT